IVSSCATVARTLSPARIWWMLAACGPGLKVAVVPSEKLRTMTRRSASIDCTVTRCLTDSTGIALWIRRASPLGCTLAVGAVQHPAKASAVTRSGSVSIARFSVLVLIVEIRLILSLSSIRRTFAAYANLWTDWPARRIIADKDKSLGQVPVKEFGDVPKGLMRLGRGVVGVIIRVGHGLEDVEFRFHPRVLQLAVHPHSIAEQKVPRARRQDRRWKAVNVAIDRREQRIRQI